MSHTDQPEYFTITSVCPHDGSTTVVGIFQDMEAVSYRLKRMYTSCGDEYRIECFHLSTAADEATACNEETVSRIKYRKQKEENERKLKEYDEWKGQIETDKAIEDWKYGKTELPDIKAEYKTVDTFNMDQAFEKAKEAV